jgi:hypothetical protein
MTNSLGLVALLLALVGCTTPNELPVPSSMRGADSTARVFSKALLTGDFETCMSMSDESISRDPNARGYFSGVSNTFLGSVVDKIEVLEAFEISPAMLGLGNDPSMRSMNRLAYQYKIGAKYLLLIFNIEAKANRYLVTDLSLSQYDKPVQELTKFSLSENTVPKLLILLLMLAVASFMIYSLVVLWKMQLSTRKKLLWSIIILLLCAPSITHTTSAVSSELRFGITLTLLGITWSKTALYQPWILTVSMPVGAIWFWAKKQKWQRKKDELSDQPIDFVSLHEAKLRETENQNSVVRKEPDQDDTMVRNSTDDLG